MSKTYIILAFHATLTRELRTLENFGHDEFINENSELINGEQHIDDQSKNNLKKLQTGLKFSDLHGTSRPKIALVAHDSVVC